MGLGDKGEDSLDLRGHKQGTNSNNNTSSSKAPLAERVSGYQTPPMVTDQSATMVIDDMTTQLYGKHHSSETD